VVGGCTYGRDPAGRGVILVRALDVLERGGKRDFGLLVKPKCPLVGLCWA
jgi:hypothetical protein